MKQTFNATHPKTPTLPTHKRKQQQKQAEDRQTCSTPPRPCCRPFAQLSVSGKYFPARVKERRVLESEREGLNASKAEPTWRTKVLLAAAKSGNAFKI